MKPNKLLLLTFFSLGYLSGYDIYPQVSAKITSIKTLGENFTKGTPLVTFDDRQINATIKKEKATLSYLKAFLDDKETIYLQDQELYDNTVLPKKDLDLSTLAYKKAKAKYDEQLAVVEYYTLELEKYSIKAPFDGVVKEITDPRNTTNTNAPKPLLKIEAK